MTITFASSSNDDHYCWLDVLGRMVLLLLMLLGGPVSQVSQSEDFSATPSTEDNQTKRKKS